MLHLQLLRALIGSVNIRSECWLLDAKSTHVRARSRWPACCSVCHMTAQISVATGPAAQLVCTPWQRISICRRPRWITRKLNLVFNLPEDDGWKATDRWWRDLQWNKSAQPGKLITDVWLDLLSGACLQLRRRWVDMIASQSRGFRC